jgi:plasmid stabilization system protein ParE
MTLRSHVKPRAKADLLSAARWYDEQEPDLNLGLELLEEFTEALEVICENPLLFAPFEGSVRRALLKRFPYAIYYEPEPKRVVILAFMHMKQHPDAWRKK